MSYTSIENLFLVGNRTLAHLLGQGTHTLNLNVNSHCIDTARLSALLSITHKLERLEITSKHGARFTKPREPATMPPNLTSLTVDVPFATEFVAPHKHFGTLPESLLVLKVTGSKTVHCGNLSDFKVPSKLTTLVLSGGRFGLSAIEIAGLPRTLIHLEVAVSVIPEMTRYVWPPELSTLRISTFDSQVVLEHLPRTLTVLSIPNASSLRTSFSAPKHGNDISFPWRSFFPFLVDLWLGFRTYGPLEHLLTQILSPTTFDAHSVSSFIANGFWGTDLPSLCYDPARTYPYFKCLFLYRHPHEHYLSTAIFEKLAPLLIHCEGAITDYGLPASALQYLPSAMYYFNSQGYSDSHLTLPVSLRSLSVVSTSPQAVKRLKSLTFLRVTQFKDNNGALGPLNRLKLPPNLKHFETTDTLLPGALLSLSSSITALSCSLTTLTSWSILARQLVQLKSLSLHVEYGAPWLWEDPLEPIQAQLTSLKLVLTVAPHPPLGLFLGAFFPSSDPSPLPPSLTDLTIDLGSKIPIPMTLCPRLPRQLERVSFAIKVDWKDESSIPEPHVAAMTPFELLASLPSGLKHLELLNYSQTQLSPRSDSLRGLPSGLLSFTQRGMFETIELKGEKLDQLLLALPPKLVKLSYHSTPAFEEAYFQRRRPNLYSGLEDE